MKPGHYYAWVIKRKSKKPFLFGEDVNWYSADRVSFKNSQHLSPGLYNARKFKTKDEAVKYCYKKLNAGCRGMHEVTVVRKKLFHDGKYLLYFENCDR